MKLFKGVFATQISEARRRKTKHMFRGHDLISNINDIITFQITNWFNTDSVIE